MTKKCFATAKLFFSPPPHFFFFFIWSHMCTGVHTHAPGGGARPGFGTLAAFWIRLFLMDNYVGGMFITARIAEKCRSSSPAVKTSLSDDHCAYLDKRESVQTLRKWWWFNLHSCFTDKQLLEMCRPPLINDSETFLYFFLHNNSYVLGERGEMVEARSQNSVCWVFFTWLSRLTLRY